jgi:hypothetical protein
MARTSRNEGTLRAAVDDVVYEVETLLFAANHLETGYSSPAVVPEGKEKDVHLESFLLHYRNLRAFLCPSLQRVDDDDVLASDFLGENEPRDSADASIFIKEKARLDKLLAHITYSRKRYAEEGNKWWPVQQMRDQMIAAFVGFHDRLPAERRAWFLSSKVLREAVQLAREQQE